MPTLVSPGVAVSVIDESFYSTAGQGTVPLILIATANNKVAPSGTGVAPGTDPLQAGVLNLFTSQRELIQSMGTPSFETKNGTVVQGSEISEYGLHAAYQYLGIANRAYVVRADIDLKSLAYSAAAPHGSPLNGTYWLDTANTAWGVFRANGNATPGLAWTLVTVKVTAAGDINGSNVPLNTFGSNGDIAVVPQTTNNAMYEKITGVWYLIGSPAWKAARPTVALGTVVNPTFTIGNSFVVNGTTVTMTGTTAATAASDISGNVTLSGLGISATVVGNKVQVTHAQGGDLTFGGTESVTAGLATTYKGYHLSYSTHTSIPVGTHSGDIWIKTTNPNFGSNVIVKRYNTTTGQFATVIAPLYVSDAAANTAYGAAKVIGSLYVQYNTLGTSPAPQANAVIKRWDGSAWSILVYEASLSAPVTDPAAGALWINDTLRVDIMVNDGNDWKGYINFYPLTDATGVQITSAQPTTQAGGAPLVDNDLWLDSSDTDNYPALYRWESGTLQWVVIDKTDQTTPFGIVFADARANADGTKGGSETTASMLASNFLDADAPNPETYPAGMLMFNTRYSTFNVKEWSPTLFRGQVGYTIGTTSFPAPVYAARWVSASGNKLDGSPFMGRHAQHQMVVKALAAVIASNEDIRSEFIYYNLLAAPGYPELDIDLQGLNIDRKETAFIIQDVPLRLKSDGTSLNNWASNVLNVTNTSEDGRTNRYTYAAEYYPHGLSTNTDGSQVVVPSSTLALRTYAYSDSVSYPWFPPAGTQRGLVSNASSVGYITSENEFKSVVLNQGQRDVLYTNNINPIAVQPQRGILVYGDKTLHTEASALDRINVARLVVFLRYQLEQLVQPFLFQLNVASTRQAAQTLVDRFLSDLIAVQALEDYAVVCDGSNNTPERIDRNELWIDIAIRPSKSINFIYIPIRILNSASTTA